MKRLLMVANPFPPMASAGNARLLRFLRHLPENGWETTVRSMRTPSRPAQRVSTPSRGASCRARA
jgi:hypothetical protein